MSQEQKKNSFKFNPWWIYGVITAIFVTMWFSGQSRWVEPSKTSVSKFYEFLNANQVEKVEIINDKTVEVYLKKVALSEKEHLKIISTVGSLLNRHRLTCVIYLLRNSVKGKIQTAEACPTPTGLIDQNLLAHLVFQNRRCVQKRMCVSSDD